MITGLVLRKDTTPIFLPYLESFSNTLPTPVQQATATTTDNTELPLAELWTSFWSDLVAQSRDHLWGHRVLCVAVVVWMVYIALFPTLIQASWYPDNVSLVVSMLVFLLVLYGSSTVQAASNFKRTLVQRHATMLAARGVFVEYKTVHEFSKCRGSSAVQCLDVFPLSVYETRTDGV
jgi:hypothetical protein